jgi:peptidyl-prolyl cis-trans isomerase C
MNVSLKIISTGVHLFFTSTCQKFKFEEGSPVFPAGSIMLRLFCAFLISATLGCGGNGASKPVATVNSTTISLSEFNKRFTRDWISSLDKSSLTPEDYNRLKEDVLNILIDEKIMLLRAKELSISVSDAELEKKVAEIKESYAINEGFDKVVAARKVDYDQWREDLRKRIILERLISADVNSKIQVKDEEIRTYRREHRGLYAPGKRVHVAQIIVREREKAEAILKRLMTGEDFAKVAREESIGPEARAGGDLGYVSQGFMPEEIDSAIFSQQPVEIGPIIRSPFGYHIFKIIEKNNKATRGGDEIRGQVLADLRKQKEDQEYALWLGALRSKAVIKINRELLKNASANYNEAD